MGTQTCTTLCHATWRSATARPCTALGVSAVVAMDGCRALPGLVRLLLALLLTLPAGLLGQEVSPASGGGCDLDLTFGMAARWHRLRRGETARPSYFRPTVSCRGGSQCDSSRSDATSRWRGISRTGH